MYTKEGYIKTQLIAVISSCCNDIGLGSVKARVRQIKN